MVSDEPLDGNCNANLDGGYCEGRPMDNGRCYRHGGRHEDDERDPGGAPENNDNAARHEMYAESNSYYQRRSEDQQALIDEIFTDYRDAYEERRGHEPLAGDGAILFKVAVGIHKLTVRADDWPDDRPESLDSGHEMVDRSEKRSPQGHQYYEHKPAAVLRGEADVSRRVRMWLKDLGLLDPPEQQQAEAAGDMANALREFMSEADAQDSI